MPTTSTYRVVVQWHHKTWGPQMHKVSSQGSSIRRALNAALLTFFKGLSSQPRRDRLDAHAHLRCEIWRVKKTTAP
jgi:hypothetical protein